MTIPYPILPNESTFQRRRQLRLAEQGQGHVEAVLPQSQPNSASSSQTDISNISTSSWKQRISRKYKQYFP